MSRSSVSASSSDPRPRWVDAALLLLAGLVVLTLLGLGSWQLQRLQWKRALIEAVETRAYGTPVPPPTGPVSFDTHAYLRIEATGRYRHELSVPVKAVTGLGPGHWIMTPLETAQGPIWVNRGFAPSGSVAALSQPLPAAPVIGLLRLNEPKGTWLETNDPASGRWVSRDIAALSKAVGLAAAAPYFIDAEATGDPTGWPRGGMTVLAFRNTHLAYALTWYGMAALLLGALIHIVRDRRGRAT